MIWNRFLKKKKLTVFKEWDKIRTLWEKEKNYPLLEWIILEINWKEVKLEVTSRKKKDTKDKQIIMKSLKDIRLLK